MKDFKGEQSMIRYNPSLFANTCTSEKGCAFRMYYEKEKRYICSLNDECKYNAQDKRPALKDQ